MNRFFIVILFCSKGLYAQPVNLYLTSDDGPGPGSRALYALADSEKVAFTLFVIGDHVLGSDSARALFRQYREDPLLKLARANSFFRSRQLSDYPRSATGLLRGAYRSESFNIHVYERIHIAGHTCCHAGHGP